METILTCAACRHIEEGDTRNGLMLKVRMWNHINRAHPELIDKFREVVHSETVTAEESAERRSALL
jgi:hypothetical protein